MKNIILVLLLSLPILSCQEEALKPQISDEKMVKILTDLHISEAAILSLNQKMKDSISNVYYNQIFEIHGVEDSVFYQDLKILRRDAVKLDSIYQKVMVKIEELEIDNKNGKSDKKSPKKNK